MKIKELVNTLMDYAEENNNNLMEANVEIQIGETETTYESMPLTKILYNEEENIIIFSMSPKGEKHGI